MKYLKLCRIKHYLKNVLVFLPLFFSGSFFNVSNFLKVCISFLALSFTASIVYIINDIKDIKKDKLHPIKKKRPLASGEVSIKQAIIVICILVILIFSLLYFTNSLFKYANLILLLYLTMNIGYSCGLKNIPLIDITILSFGFVLRVIYGGLIIDVNISSWLFLTILSMSFYMALGKRRNELLKVKDKSTREVLKFYNKDFLDKNMYMFLTLSIVFYSLWSTFAISSHLLKYSIIIVILILMKYSMNIEEGGYGDPVDVILGDKILLILAFIYCGFTLFSLYI